MDLVAPRPVRSSQIRDQTHISYIGRRIRYHSLSFQGSPVMVFESKLLPRFWTLNKKTNQRLKCFLKNAVVLCDGFWKWIAYFTELRVKAVGALASHKLVQCIQSSMEPSSKPELAIIIPCCGWRPEVREITNWLGCEWNTHLPDSKVLSTYPRLRALLPDILKNDSPLLWQLPHEWGISFTKKEQIKTSGVPNINIHFYNIMKNIGVLKFYFPGYIQWDNWKK